MKESSEIQKSDHINQDLIFRQQRRLEAALLRIENKTFGICCDCQDELPFEEFDIEPATPFCESCKEEREIASSDQIDRLIASAGIQ